MSNPVISIIVPVYNVEKYLDNCLKSILNQSFKDFEVILVNDGSKDKSGEICNIYSQKDSRIKVFNMENSGAGKARNKGLDLAQGKYIFFVDADDWLENNALEEHFKYITKYDMVIGCSKNCYFNEDKLSNSKVEYYYPANIYDTKEKVRNMYVEIAVNSVSHAPHNKMYRKEIIDTYSIRFPDYKKYEDLTFNNEYIDKINSLVILDENVYNYRVNSTEGVANKLPDNMFEIFTMVNDDLINLLKAWNVFNSYSENKLKSKYITDVASCINDSYNPYLNYTFKKRYNYIKEMIINEKVQNCCNNVKASYFVNIVSKFMRAKLVLPIMMLYRSKFIARKILKI